MMDPKISGKKSRCPREAMFARLTCEESVNIPLETTHGLSHLLHAIREQDEAKTARIAELEAQLAAKFVPLSQDVDVTEDSLFDISSEINNG